MRSVRHRDWELELWRTARAINQSVPRIELVVNFDVKIQEEWPSHVMILGMDDIDEQPGRRDSLKREADR